jgi:hypothetical protein
MEEEAMTKAKVLDLNDPKVREGLKNEAWPRSFGVADLAATSEEGAQIEGHPAVYDQRTLICGYFEEIIERGAFDSCNFDDVLFSVNHDLDRIPLARSRRNNASSTMQLQLDDIGLRIRADLDIENNAEAKSLYSSVTRGDIDGMSFIFYVADDSWEGLDTDTPVRRIQKIRKVIEVSAVNFPAYPGTDIDARDQAALDNVVAALDNARSAELDNSRAQELEAERLRTEILMKG